MDPVFMKDVLDGIRDTLFGKPLPCKGQEKLCRQMECCFYKEASGQADDLAVVINADRDLAQVETGECRLQTFYVSSLVAFSSSFSSASSSAAAASAAAEP